MHTVTCPCSVMAEAVSLDRREVRFDLVLCNELKDVAELEVVILGHDHYLEILQVQEGDFFPQELPEPDC